MRKTSQGCAAIVAANARSPADSRAAWGVLGRKKIYSVASAALSVADGRIAGTNLSICGW